MAGALVALGCGQAQADQATPPDTAEAGVGVEEPLAGDNPGEPDTGGACEAVGPPDSAGTEPGPACEDIGEATDAISRADKQYFCNLSCATAAAAGCIAVSSACVGVTVVTIAGVTMPCACMRL